MSAVVAQTDRRFRRHQVKPARHRRTWRSFVAPGVALLAVVALALFAFVRGRALIARAGMLHVDRIVVHGNERLSKGEVLGMLDGLRGQSLFGTDLDAWRRKLLESPWVQDAALRRSLPSTVDVAISERAPVGVSRVGDAMYLVDERGILIDQYGPPYSDLDLPIIDGLATTSADGTASDAARAEFAARIIASLRTRPDIAKKVSQIDVSDLHNASMILSGDPAVIYVGDDQFVQRLQQYVDLAPTLRERMPGIDYVDLRFDDRIYARPAGGAKAAGISPVAPAAPTKQPKRKRP